MFRRGYLTVFRLGRRALPIRVHWTAPIAAWLLTSRVPSPVRMLTFLGFILAHELGHAFMVRLARAEVLSVELTALGGECTWSGETTRFQRAYIAWGGVLAQAVLFWLAYAMHALRLTPFGRQTAAVFDVLTEANVGIALLNLLPVRPLDGATAWTIFPLALQKLRLSWIQRRLRRSQQPRRRRKKDHLHLM